MTDHKALEEMRRKPFFNNNNRINGWIEKIQEFDFTVEYVKEEMMCDVDALSRQFQTEVIESITEEERVSKRERINKQMECKVKKHTVEYQDKKFWEFSSSKEERY
ncbi:hypothetical protein NGRA_2777 [Nosema granulosis]|uniref:Uncharacterized protein n=1 Tax=Nosema granulosis TaxID=83296 RepID=A0A9P6GVZ6_9MICR|nr:hypothetical protein NGRA_2777 [Nosema granulosis]